ncbi:hypothetical protein [Parapedobacter sp. 2B3]|uniref:hypothetical protein n=1 Tax=Parapedobacter sp. 2B3 TaxID=3342381 RepID=UPI0035B675D2
MDRRDFLVKSTVIGLSLATGCGRSLGHRQQKDAAVRMLTSGSQNHFFGYYGINPWNRDKTYVLSLEAPFNNRLPNPGEKAAIGLVDMKTGAFNRITETNAWNLQQGCMLHWNPLNPNTEFYFNDVSDGRLVSVRFDIRTGNRTIVADTISGLSKDGKSAVHVNYGRISRLRKVVSYSGTSDPNPDVAYPEDDGVFIIDLLTGQKRLAVSYKQMADDILTYHPEIDERHMWVEHADINRDGTRFLFLPRTWNKDASKLETGLYTVGLDGTGMRRLIPYGSSVSHFGWRNQNELIATFNYPADSRSHVFLADTADRVQFQPVEPFQWDGHCSFSLDGKWLLTDGSKDTKQMTNSVWLYGMETGQHRKLATMQMLEERFLKGDARCDLHPRFSDDNSMVCVDGIDPKSGNRQIFIIETGI